MQFSTSSLVAASMGAILAISSAAHGANLVTNGDFEAGPYYPSVPTGWVVSGVTGVTPITAGGAQFTTLPDGSTSGSGNVAFFNGNSILRAAGIAQFETGKEYELSFQYGGRQDVSHSFSLSYSVFGFDGVSVYGFISGVLTPGDFDFGNWKTLVASEIAAASLNGLDIYIDFSNSGGDQPMIDNVSFQVVPEPASLGFIGAAGLMLLSRKRLR